MIIWKTFNAWLNASTYDDDIEDDDAIYEAYWYSKNKKNKWIMV
jgi:hypothetical protein